MSMANITGIRDRPDIGSVRCVLRLFLDDSPIDQLHIAWAGLIDTTSAPGISDTLLTIIVCGLMGGGFVLGLFSFMRIGGIVSLSLLGGIAFGLRVVLLKENLLIPLFALNWVLVAVMAVPSLALVIWRPRIGSVCHAHPVIDLTMLIHAQLFGVASTGTFLIALAVDLLLHTTTSLSVGLRILFDGNSSHIDVSTYPSDATSHDVLTIHDRRLLRSPTCLRLPHKSPLASHLRSCTSSITESRS